MKKSVKLFVIYKHTSPSGKSYVGQTNDYKRRCAQHSKATGKGAFSQAIKKHGWESFSSEILMDGLSLDEANTWEQFYISALNTISPAGYNLNSGGKNAIPSESTRLKIGNASKGNANGKGYKHTVGAIEKISKASKGNAHALGIKHKEDAKLRISSSLIGNSRGIGYKHTDEAIEKIRSASVGRSHKEDAKLKISNARIGMKFSDDHRKNISASQIGRKASDATRAKMSEAHKRAALKRKLENEETDLAHR